MLLVWLLVQLAALALAVGRVPLSARFVQPAERAAAAEMLVVQIGTACLLFPELLRKFSHAIVMMAATWPMLRLASLLSGEETSEIAAAATFVSIWLFALWLLQRELNAERSRLLAMAIVSMWTLGGPFLVYLHAEYGTGSEAWPTHATVWTIAAGPLWPALAHLRTGWAISIADAPAAAMICIIPVLRFSRASPKSQNDDNIST